MTAVQPEPALATPAPAAASATPPVTWSGPAALAGVTAAMTALAAPLYIREFLADHDAVGGFGLFVGGVVPRMLPYLVVAATLGLVAHARRAGSGAVFGVAALLPFLVIGLPRQPAAFLLALGTAFAWSNLRAQRLVAPGLAPLAVALVGWYPAWAAFSAAT